MRYRSFGPRRREAAQPRATQLACVKLAYIHPMPLPMAWANTVHVTQMCQSFANAGHDVRLIVPNGGEVALGDPYAYYGVERGFRIERAWHRLKIPGNGWLFATVAAGHLLRRRPDLVYTRHLPAAVMATRMGINTVFEAHGPPAVMGRTERNGLARLLCHPRLVRLTVISEALRELFLEQVDAPRLASLLHVAHDGADAGGKTAPEDPTAPFTAIYAGSFFTGRGVELAVEIARRAPEVRFRLAGCHPEALPEWQRRVAGLANIELIGRVPPAQVPALLASGHVLLAPYQDRVGIGLDTIDIAQFFSPLKMFEYMAARRAIISADLPVLKEVLIDEETALLRPGDDPDGWVAALRRLDADPGLRRRLGDAARRTLIKHYTWDSRARDVLAGLK